jgi:F-type H+-transporting ATPase subunit epsilon
VSDIPSCLRLRVVTPRRLLVDAEVDAVSLPGLDGQLGILPGHRPLMAALGRGPVEFRREGRDERHEIDGGYAEIHSDRVLIFTRPAKS